MTGHGKSGVLRLWYTDKKGESTVRDVVPVSQTQNNLVARCLARDAIRTFNKAQVKWVVDLETGEILDLSSRSSAACG